MKCKLCNEKKGSTRCEGCDMLFCLQCMNKHHGELIQQFQQLMDIRNELKELLNSPQIPSQNENKLSCFIKVDRWEQKMIEHIREIARKIRKNINEIKEKNVTKIHYQLEQLSIDMQQQEKEGNYLENDIERIKSQLDILKETIQHVNENIQVITSDNINWDPLIHVITDENPIKDRRNSFECFIQNEHPTNQDKQSNRKSTNRYRSAQRTGFRPVVGLSFQSDNSKSFRPISPPIIIQDDPSDLDRNSLSFQNITPPERIVPLLFTEADILPRMTESINTSDTDIFDSS